MSCSHFQYHACQSFPYCNPHCAGDSSSDHNDYTSGPLSGTNERSYHRILRLVNSGNGCLNVLSQEQSASRTEVDDSVLRNLQQIPGRCQPCNACAVPDEPEA